MEKRIDKLEADQADMKMLLIRIADGLFGLQREVSDGFAKVHDRMDQFERAEAERHKETVGFLSKHKRED